MCEIQALWPDVTALRKTVPWVADCPQGRIQPKICEDLLKGDMRLTTSLLKTHIWTLGMEVRPTLATGDSNALPRLTIFMITTMLEIAVLSTLQTICLQHVRRCRISTQWRHNHPGAHSINICNPGRKSRRNVGR